MNQPDFLTDQRWQRLLEAASRRQMDVSIVSENIIDPHNISAIMRSAEAFGVSTIDVIGSAENFAGHAKTSSSARLWVDTRSHQQIEDCFARLRGEGKQILVTRLDTNARSIYEVDWTKPCAIVVGNEHAGVSDEARRLADESIYIPMVGLVQSFNVSVAAAVIMAELFRQRQLQGAYEPNLTPPRQALLQKWLEREAQKRQRY